MLTCHTFKHLAGEEQMEVLIDGGSWLAEQHTLDGSSLYYCMSDFYVELRFVRQPIPAVEVIAFTEAHPQFDELLALLHVDVNGLLDHTA